MNLVQATVKVKEISLFKTSTFFLNIIWIIKLFQTADELQPEKKFDGTAKLDLRITAYSFLQNFYCYTYAYVGRFFQRFSY